MMKPNLKDGIPFLEELVAVEMTKTEIKIKPQCILDILSLDKTLIYEFHYDYMQPKFGSKIKLCYMDKDRFIYEVETNFFHKGIAKDVESRFDTSKYSKGHSWPLPVGKHKKVIGFLNDALSGKIMTVCGIEGKDECM